MKIGSIRRNDESFLYLERCVDEGAKTYSPFAGRSDVPPAFQPRAGLPEFELITVRVPLDRLSVFEADPAPSLRDFFVGRDEALFAVHPDTWSAADAAGLDELRRLPRGKPIRVAPTASTRTVLALDHPAGVPHHFLKLHLPRRISRFNRRLKRKNIRNSVAVSREIGGVASGRFAYLPDVLGLAYGTGEDAWGFLAREDIPRPLAERRLLVPAFALYSRDLKAPADPPLIVQLIERLGAEPQAFLVEEIMLPVVECWAAAARERGVLLESHAQNVLFELDREFRPRRVVHRDFDVWIDFERRGRLGLDSASLEAQGDPPPLEQRYSLVYDRFLGHEFFDYLLGAVKPFLRIDEAAARGCVKEAFHRAFPEADALFPAGTMFYFSNDPPPGREFLLEDMKQPPQWR